MSDSPKKILLSQKKEKKKKISQIISFIPPSQNPEWCILTLISQRSRLREVNSVVQGHTARKW
jgi:hypothetical protein